MDALRNAHNNEFTNSGPQPWVSKTTTTIRLLFGQWWWIVVWDAPTKITNGNCDGLLFKVCNNTTAKIIEMVMVMMICCNSDGSMITWNTSYNSEFATSNGPKQMWWVVTILCTTPPWCTLVSYKHQNHVGMATIVTTWNTTIRNFKWTQKQKPNVIGCCNYNVHNTTAMSFNELWTLGLCQDGNRGH